MTKILYVKGKNSKGIKLTQNEKCMVGMSEISTLIN